MKRFPNGVDDRLAFYQQRKQKEQPPDGVRIETLPADIDPIDEPDTERFIGGSLITLLYMTQLAAISQDPWFSRVESPLDADYTAIDLDPGEGATFAQVRDVARWVRDELAALKVPGFPKTSGSRGLHIFIPLPPGTSYESGQLFCQIVATVVASRHPKVATVERMVKKRPRGTVYVDFLQNILGKTLACAYSARASDFAGVSTPLEWDEIDESLDPRDFTIVTAPARFREVGDSVGEAPQVETREARRRLRQVRSEAANEMNRRAFLQSTAAAAFSALTLPRRQRRPRILLRSSWQVVNIGDIAHTPGVLALLARYVPEAEVRLWASADLSDEVAAMEHRRFPALQIVKGTIGADGKASNPELADAIAWCDFLLHGSGASLVACEGRRSVPQAHGQAVRRLRHHPRVVPFRR